MKKRRYVTLKRIIHKLFQSGSKHEHTHSGNHHVDNEDDEFRATGINYGSSGEAEVRRDIAQWRYEERMKKEHDDNNK